MNRPAFINLDALQHYSDHLTWGASGLVEYLTTERAKGRRRRS